MKLDMLGEFFEQSVTKMLDHYTSESAERTVYRVSCPVWVSERPGGQKNHLLIDEETAPIVRLIFGYALNGHGPNYIRRRLEEEKIPCPTWWNRERGLRNTRTKSEAKDPENGRYMWDFSVIKDLFDESRLHRCDCFPRKRLPFQNRHNWGKEAGGLDCGGGTA